MILRKPNHHHVKWFILLLLLIGVIYGYSFSLDYTPEEPPRYGMTFSKGHAQHLGLDWKANFIALLDEVGIRHFRLSAYWNDLEWPNNEFHFEDLDWQIDQVKKRGGTVTLGIGRRLPRWPECHVPQWAQSLSEPEQQQEVLNMLSAVIAHYKNEPVITHWQVENEPLLPFFGECPAPDLEFLKQEIALVRSLDDRPIMVTASGEFGDWTGTGQLGDVLGVSLYRVIWKPIVEEITYPVSPAMYALRQYVVNKRGVETIVLSELQAEPWTGKSFPLETIESMYKTMNPKIFDENIQYARSSGFSDIYLWGGEWWYWLKEYHNRREMWEKAIELWRS